MTTNAITIDVEDYFHVAALSGTISPQDWGQLECRVAQNTDKIIELFASQNIRGTFFILGWIAERFPEVVENIAAQGHEIACHGYSHQLIYRQSQTEFYEETKKAKNVLETIIGKPVRGYRAASYSITSQSLWALDVLADLGFEYDSSIVPVRHDLYGIPGAPRAPHILKTPNGKSLIEFPPTTLALPGINLPVAGGGYFRLYPYWFTRAALKWVNRHDRLPVIFYLHPWELDPEQPRVKVGIKSRFRHYNNLDKCAGRLERLLRDFEFAPAREILIDLNLVDAKQDRMDAEPVAS